MPEHKITRSVNIVIDTVSKNSYGDLEFTDKEGTEYKVGNKRAHFFTDIIVPNTAVTLNYAEAYNKEYIFNASQIQAQLSPPVKPQVPPTQKVKGAINEIQPSTGHINITPDVTRLRSMALSYSKDLAVANKLALLDIETYANRFLSWILNRDVKPTKSLDPASLPSTQVLHPVEDKPSSIDLEWLKESLKTLRDKGLKSWTDNSLLSFMKTAYKVEASNPLDAAAKLDKGQAAHFVQKIEEALSMA